MFGLFVDEIAPSVVPLLECCSECRFVCFYEGGRQCPQFSARLDLRPSREALRHLFYLMELADLHWHTSKHLEEPSLPINRRCLKSPATLFENGAAIAIVGHEFARDLAPPD